MIGELVTGADGVDQVRAHHGLEELVLAGVVQVERAFGDACPVGHLFGARGGQSFFNEEVEGCVQQFLRARGLAALPAARQGLAENGHGFAQRAARGGRVGGQGAANGGLDSFQAGGK